MAEIDKLEDFVVRLKKYLYRSYKTDNILQHLWKKGDLRIRELSNNFLLSSVTVVPVTSATLLFTRSLVLFSSDNWVKRAESLYIPCGKDMFDFV